jgi:hypothetical protein
MSFATRHQALHSLREFTPRLRAQHSIVRFWSNHHGAWRYARVLKPR